MSSVAVSLLIAGGGLIISITGAFFIAGYRRGVTDKAIETIEENVAEIKGLFELTLKQLTAKQRRR
jgi:hypothetical protein